MNRENIYISSIGSDAHDVAREYGLGIEIAHFCDSTCLDEGITKLKDRVREDTRCIDRLTLHAPFSELFPCAIDPQIKLVARNRYLQSIELAKEYGATKVVIHAGYNPHIYFPVWFEEKSIEFWKIFTRSMPDDITVCLENVLETEPEMMVNIVRAVDDERLRICLDIGHAKAYSNATVERWIETCAPFLSHLHLHNNDGTRDSHSGLTDGVMTVKELISMTEKLAHKPTYTMELLEAGPSIKWLAEEGLI